MFFLKENHNLGRCQARAACIERRCCFNNCPFHRMHIVVCPTPCLNIKRNWKDKQQGRYHSLRCAHQWFVWAHVIRLYWVGSTETRVGLLWKSFWSCCPTGNADSKVKSSPAWSKDNSEWLQNAKVASRNWKKSTKHFSVKTLYILHIAPAQCNL